LANTRFQTVYNYIIGADFMFLVRGQTAPTSVETSMESRKWGVSGCPLVSRLRGPGSVLSSLSGPGEFMEFLASWARMNASDGRQRN